MKNEATRNCEFCQLYGLALIKIHDLENKILELKVKRLEEKEVKEPTCKTCKNLSPSIYRMSKHCLTCKPFGTAKGYIEKVK